jgi:mannose-6-phosphate isomerase-like protein (cupin superfamily)
VADGPLAPGALAGGLPVGAVEAGAVDGRSTEQPASEMRAAVASRVEESRGAITGMYATGCPAVPAVLGSRSVDAFELDGLLREQAASGRLYHEFIRTHDLSVGLYVLPAGATDPQGPHTEDEVYHVVAGRARIRFGEEDRPVTAGSVIFVGADVEHRFHDIEEELVVLVVFGPAEYTHRVDHQRGQPHGAAPG